MTMPPLHYVPISHIPSYDPAKNWQPAALTYVIALVHMQVYLIVKLKQFYS